MPHIGWEKFSGMVRIMTGLMFLKSESKSWQHFWHEICVKVALFNIKVTSRSFYYAKNLQRCLITVESIISQAVKSKGLEKKMKNIAKLKKELEKRQRQNCPNYLLGTYQFTSIEITTVWRLLRTADLKDFTRRNTLGSLPLISER